MWAGCLGQEDPLEEGGQPTPVFLPGESHGQRSLAGYSPRDRTESDTTEATYHAGELLSAQRAKGIQAVVDYEERAVGQKEEMEVTIFRALQGQSASAFLPDARRQLNQGPSITFTSSPSSSNSDA